MASLVAAQNLGLWPRLTKRCTFYSQESNKYVDPFPLKKSYLLVTKLSSLLCPWSDLWTVSLLAGPVTKDSEYV